MQTKRAPVWWGVQTRVNFILLNWLQKPFAEINTSIQDLIATHNLQSSCIKLNFKQFHCFGCGQFWDAGP